ncbi:MAG: hypothetical protein OEZ08_15525 [Betaproteobacteria bacterium]|nr:hypothetical protein [Betaproteobacteria bacterium]
MTHDEFREAYAAGKAKAEIDPHAAARYVSARLLLPIMVLPVLGMGVALALVGWIFTGLALLAVGFVAPRMIKRAAPRFVLMQSLQDEEIYLEVTRGNIMQVTMSGER